MAVPIPSCGEGEWGKATEVVGVSAEHRSPEKTGSVSQYALIPFSAIKHWRVSIGIKPLDKRKNADDKKYSGIQVHISDKKYHELNKYNRAAETIIDYLNTVEHMSGFIDEQYYVKASRLNRFRMGGRSASATPLEKFLIINKPHHEFFEKLSEIAKTKWAGVGERAIVEERAKAIEEEIIKHFRLKKSRFTTHFATIVNKVFRSSNNRAAAEELAGKIGGLRTRPFPPRRS